MRQDRQTKPRLGQGQVTLEVSDPRQLKSADVYKRSEVVSLQHSYPLRILVPEHACGSPCRWIYPLTFGGGLVGGDVINLNITLGKHCAALVTSQESTKAYHCEDGQESQQNMTYHVDDASCLVVLSDPVVCFADASFRQTQRVFMSPAGNLVLLDWLTAGRVARDEVWRFTRYQSLMEVYIDDELVFRDNQQLTDSPHQTVTYAMRNFQVLGTCIVLGGGLHHLVRHLKNLYDQPYKIGQRLATDLLVSYSPLEVKANSAIVTGCYVRFMAASTSLGFGVVREITQQLLDLLGGDPYSNKY